MQILIVDDEEELRQTLFQVCKDHEVQSCKNGKEALALLEKNSVDLVLTDNQMPEVSGLELIKRGKKLYPATSFVLMTGYASIQDAVAAIQAGADDYLTKPFSLSEIKLRISRVEDLRSWKAETFLKTSHGQGKNKLIGVSKAVQNAQNFIKQVSDAPSPVLLLGPSGAGKEIIANSIHESGGRASRPFVAINCASLSEQLIESELFGHEKGSFTGAISNKPGKFELAKGGTLFLDEVGELSPNLQAKLLRVLQEREFCRIGGVKTIKSDARVITATHRKLKEMVKNGSFREDLFFRLNVLCLELPPLSERAEDIPHLVRFFWEALSREYCRKLDLSAEVLSRLCAYSYPGNVRELRNVLERLMVLSGDKGKIEVESLPPEFNGVRASASPVSSLSGGNTLSVESIRGGIPLNQLIESYEAKVVALAMEECQGNQCQAARLLGLTRGTLQYKLKKYGLSKSSSPLESPTKAAA